MGSFPKVSCESSLPGILTFLLKKKKWGAQEVCLDFLLTKLDQTKAYCFKKMNLWQLDTQWWKTYKDSYEWHLLRLTDKLTFCFPQLYFTVISISPSLTYRLCYQLRESLTPVKCSAIGEMRWQEALSTVVNTSCFFFFLNTHKFGIWEIPL